MITMAKNSVGGRRSGGHKPAQGKHVPSRVRGATVQDASGSVGSNFTTPPDTTPMTEPASTDTQIRPGGGVIP